MSKRGGVRLRGPRLTRGFFLQGPVTCARELIGVELVWEDCSGIIVETEAYAAKDDEACHMFFKPSARAFVERNQAGTAYVYLNYGVHWMANVLCKGEAPGFVLICALEPVQGIETMKARRNLELLTALCSGPGKLTKALGIRSEHHEIDLCKDATRGFWKSRKSGPPPEVIADTRIGINRAKELLWRFLAAGSPHVSVAPTRLSRLL